MAKRTTTPEPTQAVARALTEIERALRTLDGFATATQLARLQSAFDAIDARFAKAMQERRY